MRMSFTLPSGWKRGSRKQDGPAGACARIRNASHIGADRNHLCPTIRQARPPAGSARVVFVRTSEPPCFSVMPMPSVTPVFWPAGRNRGSYSGEKIRGSHCGASAASRASGGTHA